jgi:replicative DNA helicase
MTTLAAALTYADRGWHVLPIPQGKKYPRFNEWQNLATVDDDLITTWWERWPDDGVGIACGAASGIFVIDVDVADGKVGERTLAELEAQYGELPETYTVRTPTGGWHFYFRYDPTRPLGNGKLGADIDTRGEGGQVLAPPTIHPVTGTPYAVTSDLPLADLPEWCYAILLAAPVDDEPPAPAPKPAPAASGDDEDGPAQRFNEAHTWHDLLTADGWTLHHVDNRGEHHWTRPGKDKRAGSSATTNYDGRDCLKVFSPNAGLEEGRAYSRFGYYAATRHGGDRSAAARQLRADGYAPAPFDPVGWIVEQPAIPASVDPDTGEVVVDDAWEEPVPLGMGQRELPEFPVEVLPGWLADHVRAVADDIQVPIDLPATIALAVLAAVAARHVEIQADGWVTQANLYLVVASPPGQGKSPVFSAMTGCLEELQADLATTLGPDIAKAELTRRVSEKQARKAEEKGDAEEAWLHHQAAMSVEVPRVPRLIADDATPEALTKLLSENAGRIAVLSSEGGVFDLMTGKYSDRANLEVYLKAWSGDTMQVDRINREPEYVRKPSLTIGLTVQPMVIQRLANKPELAGRGLTARFMYALPQSNVGYRDMTRRRADRKGPQRAYDAQMTTLYRQLSSYQTPGRLTLSDPDVTRFFAWRQSIEVRRAAGRDLHPMAEWSTKLEASVLRLCGLLHLAYGGAHHGTIDEGALDLALTVADYWVEHAFAVHDLWGTDDTLAGARIILEWLQRKGLATFTASDVQKGLRSHFDRIADVKEPLTLLMERGWVRPLFEGPFEVGKPGRPSPAFALHPSAVPVDNSGGLWEVPREWRTTSSEDPKVVSHSRHSRKGDSEPLTLSVSGPMDGVPPANDANDAQLDDEVVHTPSEPYRAVEPVQAPDLDWL